VSTDEEFRVDIARTPPPTSRPPDARPSFERIYMELATSLSGRSTCRRKRVGCVIASPDFRKVLAVGYNGSAAGLDNDCDRFGEKAVGNCGCFTKGTLVSAAEVKRAYRRRYVGEVILVVTRNGDLTVTPNHPVLTLGRGFVAAKLLREGDHLLHPAGGQHVASSGPDDHHRVPIEDVFEAVRVSGRLVRRAGARHQFHGDGVLDEDVDVVATNRCLLSDEEASGSEGFREPFLTAPGEVQSAFRAARSPFWAARLGAEAGLSEPVLDDDAARAESSRDGAGGLPASVAPEYFPDVELDHRLALVSAEVLGRLAKHATLSQALLNRGVGDAEGRRQVHHPLAALVAADEIVRVESHRWAGHVFNLQTAAGWYGAGDAGTISQNCLHAEENAVINCDVPRATPKLVFVTMLPCAMCAKRLINLGGVRRVLYLEDYRLRDSLALLSRAGIEHERFSP
jgi:deoxycytidylate deaminase